METNGWKQMGGYGWMDTDVRDTDEWMDTDGWIQMDVYGWIDIDGWILMDGH